VLVLQLPHDAFMEIKGGSKQLEYRPRNSYWARRLEGKHYDRVTFTDGFPPKKDKSRRIDAPYRGYVKTTLETPGRGDGLPVYGILTPNHPKSRPTPADLKPNPSAEDFDGAEREWTPRFTRDGGGRIAATDQTKTQLT
jgi:hypothetical protein